jgi:hypothetical protein
MVCMNHGGLPMAPLYGHSPPPYTFVTGNLNFLPKLLSKSVVYGPDPFEDALKRSITTTPPSITTTHHNGGLSSPLSCALANDNPPIPSTPTQFKANFEGTAFISKQWLDKMGDSTACGRIGSKTSNGKG